MNASKLKLGIPTQAIQNSEENISTFPQNIFKIFYTVETHKILEEEKEVIRVERMFGKAFNPTWKGINIEIPISSGYVIEVLKI